MAAVRAGSMGRALVTGGAGFLGSHLVDRLVDDGWQVLVVDDLSSGKLVRLAGARRKGAVTVHKMDVRAEELSEAAARFSPDLVFHLAAQTSVAASVADPSRDISINVVGSVNLLSAVSAAGAERLVFASTGGAIYGGGAFLPTSEEAPLRPESPYGISKKMVEDYLFYWKLFHGLDYAVVRPSNIYGPRQDPGGEAGVVAVFARACFNRTRPTIFGAGTNTRDYVYVEDVVDAMVRASEAGGGGVYNIGTGVETSTAEVFEAVARLARFGGGAVHGRPRPGDVPRSALDCGKARRELGWEPFTSFEDGIRLTIDWFSENL